MNCLDCLAERAQAVPAVAVCLDCGAGVCLEHAVLVARRVDARGLLGRRIPLSRGGRVVRCEVCQRAHDAVVAAPVT
ncbi:MAG TPA: DUF2180 family protein [Motilibacteraceae bacterium]|nr:DUF2180 family protein [Motilibacteraceae bacterium]